MSGSTIYTIILSSVSVVVFIATSFLIVKSFQKIRKDFKEKKEQKKSAEIVANWMFNLGKVFPVVHKTICEAFKTPRSFRIDYELNDVKVLLSTHTDLTKRRHLLDVCVGCESSVIGELYRNQDKEQRKTKEIRGKGEKIPHREFKRLTELHHMVEMKKAKLKKMIKHANKIGVFLSCPCDESIYFVFDLKH